MITAAGVSAACVWAGVSSAQRLRPLAEAAAKLSVGSADRKAVKQNRSHNEDISYYWEDGGEIFTFSGKPQEPSDKQEEDESEPVKSCEFESPGPSAESLAAVPYQNGDSCDGEIVEYDFSGYSGDGYVDLDGGAQVKNCTDKPNDELYKESLNEPDFTIEKTSEEPQILIYHTHTTESFEKEEKQWYDSTFPCKTTDSSMNMVAVGDEICAELDKAGIGYVHDRVIHDYPSYDDAYDSSRASVSELLERYPSIKVVLDVHRDGIEREDGTRLAPMCEIDGSKAAQIMIISGCDDGTMGMPQCMKNFRFACLLQRSLEADWPGLTRPVLFDYRHYNQDLSTGALLIEVGSQANTIDQVCRTARMIGRTLGELAE